MLNYLNMIVLLSHPLSRDFLTLQGAEDLSRINSSPAGLAEGGGDVKEIPPTTVRII